MNPKNIIDYLRYLWPHRKTKRGLFAISLPIFSFWATYVLPEYSVNPHKFYTFSISLAVLWLITFIFWLFHSGRLIKSKQPFTVIFCLKASDAKATQYSQNSIKILRTELDKLGLLQKIKIKEIGSDIINNQEEAKSYREKFDVGLIIWGEIFTGSENGQQVCDFKKLFFTYEIPGSVKQANIYDIFKNDINIALVNRDWNIYEINSLPDTEKLSENLSEIILFISGLIYAQYFDFAEDSGLILESLFNLLEAKTKNEKIVIDDINKPAQIQMSPGMLRKGRILSLLLDLYKALGIIFVDNQNYSKGIHYLNKCIIRGRKDVDILSSAALASFYLKDLNNAHLYTDQINEVEKNHPIYILNHAFFGIYKKNYASALFFYKEIIKRDKDIDNAVIIRVIAFLDERKYEDPKELAYDFAIGILNKFHSQKRLGEKDLRQFVKEAKRKEQYKEMVLFIESENLLNKRGRGRRGK